MRQHFFIKNLLQIYEKTAKLITFLQKKGVQKLFLADNKPVNNSRNSPPVPNSRIASPNSVPKGFLLFRTIVVVVPRCPVDRIPEKLLFRHYARLSDVDELE